MALPPPQRLWVGIVVVMVVVVELPGALQKCIFDEVQAEMRVVRAAPIYPNGPPSEARLRALARRELPPTSGKPPGQPGWRASPLRSLTVKQSSSLGKIAPHTPPSPQPIRIQTWIPRESENLSGAENGRLEAAVEEAVRIVSSLLSVNRVQGPLLLSRDINKYCKFVWRNSSAINYNRCGRAHNNYRSETCLGVTIPDDHLAGCDIYPEADSPRKTVLRPDGGGLPHTDFLLYLHVQSTDKCRAEKVLKLVLSPVLADLPLCTQPTVAAYAVHCQTDSHGRPVAGVVVICRHRLAEETYTHQATAQAVIHELFHALGFSKDLFHTWRDCSSSSQVGVGCAARGEVIHPDGWGQMRIYTQSVISALQKHLASTDPELGGPLENLDVLPGGVSSHWESRVLQGSIMAAALEDFTTVRIDPVTLAALQDTGWYTVNLSQAQSLVWGDGEGAMFGSLSTCQDSSSSFFCTGSALGCHFRHLHKGECQTDPYLEGCQVYKPLKNRSECWKRENSRGSAGQARTGEVFGFDSRCFFTNLTRQNQSQSVLPSSSVEGRCYRHRCTGPNRYQIQVSGCDWVDCPAGGTMQIKGYQGVVFCPDRRLCLYPDVAPPSGDVNIFPVPNTSDHSETVTSGQDGTRSPLRPTTELTAVTGLSFAAAVCVLVAVMASYRKCRSFRARIHSAPVAHSDP
ncbi:leishmanolysin-like peptidase 2 [Mastacembelus armatus]|uniref:leishmanolysin-like peptidase 2 n=1 Tax=Mastacembelus armatus TaxID=205130 RepID=UPI000E4542EC|nr:leishmanolysin-like peptidase 2 [Mastacembelus armatus]